MVLRHTLKSWVNRYLADEQAVLLLFLILLFIGFVLMLGQILAPVIAAVILAFVMQGPIINLTQRGVPNWLALGAVYTLFMGVLLAFIFLLLPLIWNQVIALFNELPRMLQKGQELLLALQSQYPQLISDEQLSTWLATAGNELGKVGQWVLSISLASLTNLVAILIYLILVPILTFFFLKDKDEILSWLGNFLPTERHLIAGIWDEMNVQFANYVRGKVVEVIIVGGASYITFVLMGLNYAALLGLLVGLSVIIPYVGAAVVTIPVVLIAAFQWGWTSEFFYLVLAYGVIQTIDGNVVVPLLFSEAVNLHPVAIIVAVLFFGGIWGVWGVFFAIPLATLVNSILNAWPRELTEESIATDVLTESE